MSALTSSRVVTWRQSALWVSRQPIAIDDKAPPFRPVFSSVNYNNVYGRWIITQYLKQIKENGKLNDGGFNEWLEILAGKHLQTKLRKSENVDTWNVLPVVPENDKSAGLRKVKVRFCFIMCLQCLLMVTTCSNNEAGDQSWLIDRFDMNRKLQDTGKTIYWFLFLYWRHNCSRCCKWLMESYMNKLTRSDSGGFHTD